MKKRILCLLLCLSLTANVSAAAPGVALSNQIAAVVQYKAAIRGFAANDPRFGAALSALGTAATEIGVGVVAAGTAPAWGTVLASAAVAGVIGYGLQALANWIFNKDGTLTIPASGAATPVLPSGKCYRNAAGGACYGSISDVLLGGVSFAQAFPPVTNQYGTYSYTLGTLQGSGIPGLYTAEIDGVLAHTDHTSSTFVFSNLSANIIFVDQVA